MFNNKEEVLSRVLITGADGMVGSYVDFGIKTNRRSLDITDLNEVMAVCNKYKPKVILHLAAETDVLRCERDPQYAYLANTIGTYNMAIAAKGIGAKLVYISTSAIFNGTKKGPYKETDEADPQSYYGRSKHLGEIIIKDLLKDYVICRICSVFGGGPSKDQKFISKVIKQINNKEIKVVANTFISPTYGKDLVGAIKKLILKNQKGTFHLSNTGNPSRMKVVSEIIKLTKSKADLKEVDKSFFRNVYGAKILDNESMTSRVKIMRPWKDALKEYIETEWKDYVQK